MTSPSRDYEKRYSRYSRITRYSQLLSEGFDLEVSGVVLGSDLSGELIICNGLLTYANCWLICNGATLFACRRCLPIVDVGDQNITRTSWTDSA